MHKKVPGTVLRRYIRLIGILGNHNGRFIFIALGYVELEESCIVFFNLK